MITKKIKSYFVMECCLKIILKELAIFFSEVYPDEERDFKKLILKPYKISEKKLSKFRKSKSIFENPHFKKQSVDRLFEGLHKLSKYNSSLIFKNRQFLLDAMHEFIWSKGGRDYNVDAGIKSANDKIKYLLNGGWKYYS